MRNEVSTATSVAATRNTVLQGSVRVLREVQNPIFRQLCSDHADTIVDNPRNYANLDENVQFATSLILPTPNGVILTVYF